jgi:hypothetical protein
VDFFAVSGGVLVIPGDAMVVGVIVAAVAATIAVA